MSIPFKLLQVLQNNMLWEKTRYRVNLRGGKAEFKTTPMHGLIQQMIIEPANETTVWSAQILDSEGDRIFGVKDHIGRLDNFDGLPVGRDTPEQLKVLIYDTTSNEPFCVMFKVREGK